MADAAMAFLLENLSHFLVYSADLISGAEDEIELLKNEVESLRVFLQDAASKPKKEEAFAELAWQIEDVVYDAQYVIDSCLSQAVAAQCKIDHFRRRRALNTEPVRSMAEVVRSLREDKVKPMLEKARVYFADMLLIGDGSETVLDEPHLQIELNKILPISQERSIGFKDEQATITHYLKEKTEKLDFISIVGMAGQGKTTLARQIYQSQEIQYEFPTRIWVNVSRDFNRRDVFLNILKEATSKDMSLVSDPEIAFFIHEFLEKSRFLIVLDDVWSHEAVVAIKRESILCPRDNQN